LLLRFLDLLDDHRRVVGHDDDPADHHRQRNDLARYGEGLAVQRLAQPQSAEEDRDDRVTCGDDGKHRREQLALLEGVLVEHEAHRCDHHEGVERPGGEQVRQAAAGNELDQERRRPVANAAGQGHAERPDIVVVPGDGQAGGHECREPGGQRDHDGSADRRMAARRPGDGEERGHAGRGGKDSPEHDRIPPVTQVGVDQYGEDQVAHEDRLDQRERPVLERDDLKNKAEQRPADGQVPHRRPYQVDQDPERQRLAWPDLLGPALLGNARYPEHDRGGEGCDYGDRVRQ
jgi:hypothetical protein